MLQSRSAYQSFDFLQLDNKLNTKKLQQKKKQQRDKNVLTVCQKKLPNLQFVKQCNNIMTLYKNHYNINRRFSLFNNSKKPNDQQNRGDAPIKQHLPFIRLERSQSTQNLPSKIQPNNTLIEAEKIMKPIKTNHHLNENGYVQLSKKQILNKLKNQSSLETIPDMFKASSSFRKDVFKNILSLTKDPNNLQLNPSLSFDKQQGVLKNKSKKEKKRQLKLKFRKTIFLIIKKMKIMKILFSDIIEKDPFDKKTPYKFGQQIFVAVKQGEEPKVFRIMLQNRLSIFSIDTTGKTTLMWACIRAHAEIVQLLLSNGVQLHSADINRRTAIFFAIKYNNVKCVKSLFIYSKHLEPGIQLLEMSQEMRKMIRIGISTHKFLNTFQNVEKRREYFEQEYRYYFKE